MRKLLTLIFAALFVALVGLPVGAHAAQVNTLIKGSGATIYWAADNSKKYAFPNIETFYTWFGWSDLKTVKKVSEKELKAIPTSGNVTYRCGAKLVKFPGESTVYAVSRYGILRPILNEQVASELYPGRVWTSMVETLPTKLRADYVIGSMIRVAYTDYSASQEYNGVRTPSDNIRPANIPNTTFQPNLSTSVFQGNVGIALTNRLYSPERAQFTVTVSNSNRNANELTITVKNETRNQVIQTCYATYTCTATWNVDTVATQEIVAIAKDASGYSISSNRLSVQGLNNSSYYSNYNSYPYTSYPYYSSNPYYGNVGTVNLSLSSSNVYANEQVTAYAEVKNYYPSTDRLTIEIYVDGSRIGSCPSTTTCSLTFNNPTGNTTRQVYARVLDNNGASSESLRQNVYVSDRSNSYYYNGGYYNYQGGFWADARLNAEWTNDRKVRLTGRIVSANRSAESVRFSIVDRYNNQTLKNCNGFDSCSIDVTTDSNSYDVNRYAVIATDWNGEQLNYVYAPSLGTNPYAYNSNYNNWYNGYYYNTPTVTTEAYRSGTNNWWAPTYTVNAAVTNISNVNNTRLEIYVIENNWGGNPRLINTCYNVSTCTTQDTPSLTYGSVSYYSVFIDGNGGRTNSATRSS